MRILVAGVGNVFLGDDGFGVAVARRLARRELPDGVVVTDFGIRGVHLAYEIAGGEYSCTIMVDAVSRDGPPGTLYVLRPSPGDTLGTFVDAHDMTPDAVLAFASTLGGNAGPVLLVGCEAADVSPGMELSPPVAEAVGRAEELVLELIRERWPAATDQQQEGTACSSA
ncbi:hydrogenase maturation protease [Sphaerisporangium fuscum]|uniref:hydrogenase maturation protease n=1 Tax=Sphaerisporangium fuscum TaxID=2835868 RepID=UPI001BDD03A3|nr:hydrogenase maturation protease [Sphaerisporangium fuscum]